MINTLANIFNQLKDFIITLIVLAIMLVQLGLLAGIVISILSLDIFGAIGCYIAFYIISMLCNKS